MLPFQSDSGEEATRRELLLRGGLPLLAAEPAVVRRVHERIEAGHELHLLAVQVLIGRQVCKIRVGIDSGLGC